MESGFFHGLLRYRIAKNNMAVHRHADAAAIQIIAMILLGCCFCVWIGANAGRCICGGPPQILGLPLTSTAVMFSNTPPIGSFPSKLLKEISRC